MSGARRNWLFRLYYPSGLVMARLVLARNHAEAEAGAREYAENNGMHPPNRIEVVGPLDADPHNTGDRT